MVVALGALGAVTRVTLDVEPAYEVRQRVFEGCLGRAVRALRRDHRARLQRQRLHPLGRRARPGLGQEPVRRRSRRADLFGARAATVRPAPDPRPAIRSTARRSSACPGPWSDRLPHFRMGFTPSAGEELQSRVPRPAAARRRGDRGGARRSRAGSPAPAGLRDPHDRRRPAVDEPAVRAGHARPPLHVDPRRAGRSSASSRTLEAALAPFGARPHWGKLFLAEAERSRRSTNGCPTSRGSSSGSTRAVRSATSGSSATSSVVRIATDRRG